MKRTVTAVAAASALSAAPPSWAATPKERPNVLIFLLDDLGYSDLGCYGGEIPTPNIDALAKGGVRFTHFYNSARCCPSRASLNTGLYPHQTGIGSFSTARPDKRRGPAYLGHLNDRCVTLAETLKASGYNTYMSGKWHMGLPGPIKRGFDEFYGYTMAHSKNQWEPKGYFRLPKERKPELEYEKGKFYVTDVFSDYAMEFLRQARKKEEPWFLYVAHSSPHFPVQAPRESIERFLPTYRRGWDALRKERFARMQKIGLAQKNWKLTPRSMVPVDRPDIANEHGGKPNPAWADVPTDRREDLAHRMAIFAAMVNHVDQGVGRLVDDMKAHGELDNTIVLLMSDNGACYEWGPYGFDGVSRKGITKLHKGDELLKMGGPDTHHSYGSAWANLGNTPFRLYKHFTHEGGVCSPFIAHWPRGIKQKDRWVREPGHMIDVMPTVCAATGAKYPKLFGDKVVQPTEGLNLLPAFNGAPLAKRSIFFEHQLSRAVRNGKWKLVWVGKRWPTELKWELYDMERDPMEMVDLAERMPEKTAELSREWMAWAKRVKIHPFYLES